MQNLNVEHSIWSDFSDVFDFINIIFDTEITLHVSINYTYNQLAYINYNQNWLTLCCTFAILQTNMVYLSITQKNLLELSKLQNY